MKRKFYSGGRVPSIDGRKIPKYVAAYESLAEDLKPGLGLDRGEGQRGYDARTGGRSDGDNPGCGCAPREWEGPAIDAHARAFAKATGTRLRIRFEPEHETAH